MQHFWTTAELKARGTTARGIASASSDGRLSPVRTGCFARPATPPDLVRAVRVGGVATAHTAARVRGLWVPPDTAGAWSPTAPDVLRVAVPRTSARRRLLDPDDPEQPLGDRPDVVVSWVDPLLVRQARGVGMVGVLVMLRDVFRVEPPERALAVLDSALRHRHLRPADLHALAAMLPGHLAPIVHQADARAESGTETITRYLLTLAGLRVEPQARIAGLGRVDLLVEDRVAIEIDGRRWHDDEARFEEDRRRDLVAVVGRYRVLRFSWYQVLFRWDDVQAAVLAALAA